MSFEQQWEEEGRKQKRREWEERIKRHNVRVNQKRILQAVKLKREKKGNIGCRRKEMKYGCFQSGSEYILKVK